MPFLYQWFIGVGVLRIMIFPMLYCYAERAHSSKLNLVDTRNDIRTVIMNTAAMTRKTIIFKVLSALLFLLGIYILIAFFCPCCFYIVAGTPFIISFLFWLASI
jgi:hypothetical protein